MALDYPSWLQAVTTYLNVNDTYGIAAFTALVPRIIELAELRIYREPALDPLLVRSVDVTQLTNSGLRAVPIPTQFIIVEGVSLITPANTRPALGQRIRLSRATREFCDTTWPTEATTQAPDPLKEGYWALYSMFEAVGSGAESDETVALPSSIIIAPTPDGQYVVEIIGTIRPAALSATNATTPLTQHYPDLFLAASVAAGAAYQRDFGSDNNPGDPSLATYWNNEYQRLLLGAAVESARQKAQGAGWSPYPPAPLANQSRTGGGSAPPMPPAGG